ncbi:DNA repair-scaffolding protein [Dunckerocampus dactyliophorus]|uniref:DNA repair-scaffolding protein n=1 Tax=Dunckerocampus dactyliophorus TaxID=161453 RepID=UPI002404F990|nr:DNA repair-scaffolding protein [Dunckerocampus dactyliophorus]
MSSRKRKKCSKDLKCVFFPDNIESGDRAVRKPSALSSSNSASSWERCGDSFLDCPLIKDAKTSGRKLSAVRKLAHPSLLEHCNEDPVHIAWSSSESGQSDNDDILQQHDEPQGARRPSTPFQSYTKALHMLSTDGDDPPVIETDSEQDGEDFEKDSGQQISDCESASCQEEAERHLIKPTDLEISGYVSNGDSEGETLTTSRLDTESPQGQTGEGSKRSVSDWVRCAHAMLQTPRKAFDGQSKTPDDSAKKKRKFQSGGLAERLNRLQCRQRSAVSFWRHRSISDNSPQTQVDRHGMLVLKVLEVQVECSMQLVRCQHRPLGPTEGHQHQCTLSEESAKVLVLFCRETAAQLSPAPADIIHIYPPWQSLSLESLGCDIILNTHFSRKVSNSTSRGLLAAKRVMPYPLSRTFRMLEVCRGSEENDTRQVVAADRHPGILPRCCLSLLESIEGMGQAGSVSQDVMVVVQRVYSIPVPDFSRLPSRSFSAPPAEEKGKSRLCVLVQDNYGMFSVVQLHILPCQDDLRQYHQAWQGRTCMLTGVKVVQRVTRDRRSSLFSLIDSLWPPLMPLECHGNTPSLASSRPPGPAPSFCYLLSGQENSVEPVEDQSMSSLHLPSTEQTLRDILQSEPKTYCCSFVATVVYKRIQSRHVGQGEVWLVLTDPSLQDGPSGRPCRRTAAVHVNTSCVLTSSVLKVLQSTAMCRLSFRDAIKEHGVLLCVEHSVIDVTSRYDSVDSAVGPQSPSCLSTETSARPVRLDPLDAEVTPNSLCTLTGVIVAVDESTARSWPACSHCGSRKLDTIPSRGQSFHCVSCKSVVDKPDTDIEMEVFLSSAYLQNCTIKVKLLQKTIMSVLDTAALERTAFSAYNADSVLGKELGPLTVYVRVVTRRPSLWLSLEEISL